jgi:hypothetical protein
VRLHPLLMRMWLCMVAYSTANGWATTGFQKQAPHEKDGSHFLSKAAETGISLFKEAGTFKICFKTSAIEHKD